MIEIRSFRDIVRLLFIYRREFKWALGVTIVVAVLGAFLLPPRYESEARLLVKPGRENSTLPIEISDRQALMSPVTQRDPITDDEKILTGRPIIRKVAERYLDELSHQPKPHSLWKRMKNAVKETVASAMGDLRDGLVAVGLVEQQSPEDRLAKQLEKGFSVNHASGSSVMELSFTWNDPEVAQKVLSTWVTVYFEERRRALGNPSLYAFYETQGQKMGQLLDDYRAQLTKVQSNVQAVDVKARLDSLSSRIETLQNQRGDALAELQGMRSSIASNRSLLSSTPREITKERQQGLNPIQLDLRNRLNDLTVQRASLLRVYQPTAPQVKELDGAIADVEGQIRQLPDKVQLTENFAPNSVATSLQQGLVDRETRMHELEASIAEKDKQVNELMAERQRVLAAVPEAQRLNRMLEATEKNYALYAESLEKARIDRELDLNRISNIAVVEDATMNPARVFPKSLGILLAALPAGILVGLLAIYLCYLIDQRIHDGGRVEETFHVPLWATIPDQQTASPVHVFTASAMRVINLLPLDRVASSGLTVGLTSSGHGEGVSFVAEQLHRLLQQRGYEVQLVSNGRASPGSIHLLDGSALLHSEAALTQLQDADLILLVVAAQSTTVPMVAQALQVLTMAFKRVDGIIINRRRFEIPEHVLRWFGRWRHAPLRG